MSSVVRSLILAFALVLFGASAFAADSGETLSFADALYQQEDYYRAITEYKRFIHHFPQDPRTPDASLKIGRSLMRAKRWTEAENSLQQTRSAYPASPAASAAALLHADIPFERGDFPQARQRYRLLLFEDGDGNAPLLDARIAWTLIEDGLFDEAQTSLERLETSESVALAEALRHVELPRKSPELAGGLSAVLPGAGQLYVGRPRDAALAFTLNAAFTAAAWESFDSNQPILGAILLFFEAGWYSGNIFNAASHAHKYNRQQLKEYNQKLRNRFEFDLGLSGATPLLGVRLQY